MKKQKSNDELFRDSLKSFSREEKDRFKIMFRILNETSFPITDRMYEIVMNIFTKNNKKVISVYKEEKEKEGLEVTKLSILKEINGLISIK